MTGATALLRLSEVDAFYGQAHILHRMNLLVESGEQVALIGRNGVGKSTVVNAILGLARIGHGEVCVAGAALARPRPYDAPRRGVAVVPQGRRIIANLSVQENLALGAFAKRKGEWTLSRVYELFPVLRERAHSPGTALSGGQQQMLAVGRALMANPDLLILDEPTEGLAPAVIDTMADVFARIASRGTGLLLIEQNMRIVARTAKRFVAMAKGCAVAEGEVPRAPDGLEELERHVVV